jgi:ubiquinone/menaquinone biosynthesis C-methylase UbiE
MWRTDDAHVKEDFQKSMNEVQWRDWLHRHSDQVLDKAGIGEKSVVLDFGCGSGAYALPAARLAGAGGKVYALDRDVTELEALKQAAREEGLQNIETIVSSDLSTGLRDRCVDVVLLHDVLHMIDERMTLFGEVCRILKSCGRVSVYPMHVDKDEVSRQMRDSGFALQADEYEGNILVFGKAEQKAVGGVL